MIRLQILLYGLDHTIQSYIILISFHSTVHSTLGHGISTRGSPFSPFIRTPANQFQNVTELNLITESRVPQILIGSILPSAIVSLFVLARFYSRGYLLRSWGYDDSWILVSWVVLHDAAKFHATLTKYQILGGIALTILNCLLTRFGAGRHVQAPINQNLSSLERQLQLAFASRILYQTCLMTTKIAICEFYKRIFSDRRSRIFIWCMIASVVAFSIPVSLSVVFECKTISGKTQLRDKFAGC